MSEIFILSRDELAKARSKLKRQNETGKFQTGRKSGGKPPLAAASAAHGLTRFEILKFMSCVCILTPVVIAAWPAFSAAVVAAATSLVIKSPPGAANAKKCARPALKNSSNVRLEIENSEVVTGQLGRDQRIFGHEGGVTITFSRDARGKASLCVTGEGHSQEELSALGEELSQAVVQQYVYQKLMREMQRARLQCH